MTRIDPEAVRRILVRANNWIGDVVMISPALAALRDTFPGARIEAVVRPHVADCFDGHPSVDGVIVQDPREHRGIRGFRRFTAALAERRYDLAVLFQKAFSAALMARMARVPIRIGYDTDHRRFLLTHPIRETEALRRIHHVEYFLGVARAAGCPVDVRDLRVSFPLDDESREAARRRLAPHEGRHRFFATIAVGASKPPRAWHPERFADVARWLVRERDAGVVVVGGPGDRAAATPVLDAAADAAIDAVGSTSVREMAALIESSSVFIGNDSGPMHVAAALDVPVVAIFGPGDPAKTAPYMDRERYALLTESFPCSPCRQDFFKECEPAASLKPMCLETIPSGRAIAALDELLRRTLPG